MSRSHILKLTSAGVLFLLSACGGGSGGSTAPVSPSSPPAYTPLSERAEASAVKDVAATYAVEDTTKVIEATITTTDGVYTFAQVNSDIDPDDDFVPEVDAHFNAENYPDDGLLLNNAKIRLRGNSSRLAVQKSYRVKLNKANPSPYGLWRGETTLQLNKHPWDLTRVRNKLAFDLFTDIPHFPSLRTQFMHLTINGEDYGLFTHVEKMGKEYLTNRGLSTDGNIYKANDFNFNSDTRLQLDTTGNPLALNAFELVLELENDNKDHSRLIEMITAVNDETQAFDPVFEKYFDRNNYLVWLAVNILAGNRDTINQNFALYQPKDSTKFYFLPWDYDGAFGLEGQPDMAAEGVLNAPWQLGLGNWWGSPLHQRFIKDPARLQEIQQAVDDIYTNYLTEAKIQALLDRYKPLVEPLITRSPDLDHLPIVTSSATDEWAGEYARLVTTVTINYDLFNASLEKPMPFWQDATVEAGHILLTWDSSVDLQNDTVTYSIRVGSDPAFQTTVFSRDGVTGTSVEMPLQANGTYYLKVTATDSKGNSQGGFDIYIDQNDTKYFGVFPFVVTN